jgi:hypothetical protein
LATRALELWHGLERDAGVELFANIGALTIGSELEQGVLNKDQLQNKYGIGGKSTVLEWCRKYGKFAYNSPAQNGRPMKDPQKQRIKELEKKLKAAELKLKVYDKLIEITNRELKQDVIKKIEAELSRSLHQKGK